MVDNELDIDLLASPELLGDGELEMPRQGNPSAGCEAAFAQIETRAGARARGATQERVREAALLGLIGAAGLWVSYTSVMFLAVAGFLLIATPLRARNWRATALYAAMGSAWLASFVPVINVTGR